MPDPEDPTRAVPAAGGNQPPGDGTTRATPLAGGQSSGDSPPTQAAPGGVVGSDGDDPTKRGGLVFGGAVVLVVGLLTGVGAAAATRDRGAEVTVSSSPTTTPTTRPPTTTTTKPLTTTTAPSTTTTAPSTTTTTTTVPLPSIVSFTGPIEASCPTPTVLLSWTTQNATGTQLSVAGGPPSAQAASGSLDAPFDCTVASVPYMLSTTGGSPAASQNLTVTNNISPP